MSQEKEVRRWPHEIKTYVAPRNLSISRNGVVLYVSDGPWTRRYELYSHWYPGSKLLLDLNIGDNGHCDDLARKTFQHSR